jgi:PHP family Zn ribbon phosphoesterase
MRLLPLSEIIATALHIDSPYSGKVWSIYNPLIEKFGDEYSVVIDRSKKELGSIVGEQIAEAIVQVREGRANVVPGYDGVYGRLVIPDEQAQDKISPKRVQQLNLGDFAS